MAVEIIFIGKIDRSFKKVNEMKRKVIANGAF